MYTVPPGNFEGVLSPNDSMVRRLTLGVAQGWPPAEALPSCTGSFKSRAGSFSDQTPFKFRHRGQNMEDEATARRSSVYVFRQALEIDLSFAELFDDPDKVLNRAP
ncbi:hypothetical protein RHSP_60580 [Rhizobium freirei PRF 81]|uniref:Uncharacterized protein n=1 Tax=Rhizobium freirei PRF 81 TaxID=363754 RepID=N6V8M6_9HYPH|nr:hypothetical protein RHSP_60580 [Rhizobium freirei PRF 81]